MRICKIFNSLQGEGIYNCVPMTFVRMQGCNLHRDPCRWCDTSYALKPEKGCTMSVVQVVKKVLEYSHKWVCITGGEPLYQPTELNSLVIQLKDVYLRNVEIETNGTLYTDQISPTSWCVDFKGPSSGHYNSVDTRWLDKLGPNDSAKFVVANEGDLIYAAGCIRYLKCTCLISPVTMTVQDDNIIPWDLDWLQRLAEFCKEYNVRLSMQLHRLIYGDKRGV